MDGTCEGYWRVYGQLPGWRCRGASAQVKFATEVGALVQVLEDMGNPLMEESEDLLVLDSRDVADPAIVQTVGEIEKTGQDQYKYISRRVIEQTTPVF